MSTNEYKNKCDVCGKHGDYMFARIYSQKIDGTWKHLCCHCWSLKNGNPDMKYVLFFTGLATMPHSVGIKCLTAGEVIEEIVTSKPSGKETREVYEKTKKELETKYAKLLNDKKQIILDLDEFPTSGKTTMLRDMAIEHAMKNDIPIQMTFELDPQSILDKIIKK